MSAPRQIVLPEVVTKRGVSEHYGMVVGVAGLSALLHSGYMVYRVVAARRACVLEHCGAEPLQD